MPALEHELGFVYLHFHDGNYQSLMRKSRPYRLELGYTRTMMGFLLFQPEPRHVVLIGMGGGSMTKYCYRYLPRTRLTAVEIDPRVIALRREFRIPEDDARFRVLCADGAAFVQGAEESCDVLTVDGFDAGGQSRQLCSPAFYRNACERLVPGGVLVVNVLGDDAGYPIYLKRLQRLFGKAVFTVPSEDCENRIIFAVKPGGDLPDAVELHRRSALLQTRHKLDLDRIAGCFAAG